MTAIQLIQNERDRQILKGFDAAHDDGHTDESILLAAVRVAADAHTWAIGLNTTAPGKWARDLMQHVRDKYAPRERVQSDRIPRLVIAAALLVAEIERLQRLAPAGGAEETKRAPAADATEARTESPR